MSALNPDYDTRSVDDFSDLDDLDSVAVRPESKAETARKASVPMVQCPRCRGTGQFTFGYTHTRTEECHQCKGTKVVRADWQQRREAHFKGEKTKSANLAAKAQAWQVANPAEWQWIQEAAPRFDFAASTADAICSRGSLTEKQLAAVRNCVIKDDARAAERAKQRDANSVDISGANAIADALNKASVAGRKAPKIRTEVAHFSLAKPASPNAGCVYVKDPDGTYLGKITIAGAFQPSRDCSVEAKAAVVRVSTNALAEAVEFGRRTGVCSCCGRELTDPASIAAGIGPICAEGFF
jgi:hypothetical protein